MFRLLFYNPYHSNCTLLTISTKDMDVQLFTKVHYKSVHLRQETNEKYYWETECKHYGRKEKVIKKKHCIHSLIKLKPIRNEVKFNISYCVTVKRYVLKLLLPHS